MVEPAPAPVVLVTGGAQDLASRRARQMAERGWTVAIADVNAAPAQVVAGACGDPAFGIVGIWRLRTVRRTWSWTPCADAAGWTCWSAAPLSRPPWRFST